MRLLFVGTHHGGGGTESHFVTLAKAMRAAGHDVAAVVRSGTPIHQGLKNSDLPLYHGVFRNAFDPRGAQAVWQAISAFKPDWIIGSFSKEYWPLAIIAKLRGIKLALFKHMDYPLRPATHFFIPRMADRFIVISNFMRDTFIQRGINPEHIQMLYNPLDLSYFCADPALRRSTRQQFGYAENDIVVGFVGAMHPDKGMLPLCDALNLAMTEVPNLKALWIGEGRAEQDLKIKIQASGLANHHVIHPWTSDVRPYYAAMDILAMPTLVTETFGRVSIEAQASGVPVLCSQLGGLPETLNPEVTGKLLPVGDIPAWKEAILQLTKDAELRRQFQTQGRAWVEQKFSASAIAQEFTKLLEKRSARPLHQLL